MKCNLIEPIEKPCKSNEENSNKEIAENEGLIYIEKYNLFFKNKYCLSRYIESLYRQENDWRINEEIAEDANIEFKNDTFSDNYIITPEDIACAFKKENISMSFINRAKKLFKDLLKEMFKGR